MVKMFWLQEGGGTVYLYTVDGHYLSGDRQSVVFTQDCASAELKSTGGERHLPKEPDPPK